VATAKEDVIRAQAEMANVRRRAEKDVENARRYSIEKIAKDILPVVDNLERALAAAGEESNAVTEGVELTLKSMLSTLEKHKIEVINPVGEPFDPDQHEAISMVPNPDMEPNTVMDVVQKGYSLYGRVIRAAMVVVAQ
jgi:molecular chaperone GrpE